MTCWGRCPVLQEPFAKASGQSLTRNQFWIFRCRPPETQHEVHSLAVTIWPLWDPADGLRAPLLGCGVPGPPHAPTATPLTVAQNFASQSQPACPLGERWLESRGNFWRTRWKLHFVIQAQANCSFMRKTKLPLIFICLALVFGALKMLLHFPTSDLQEGWGRNQLDYLSLF